MTFSVASTKTIHREFNPRQIHLKIADVDYIQSLSKEELSTYTQQIIDFINENPVERYSENYFIESFQTIYATDNVGKEVFDKAFTKAIETGQDDIVELMVFTLEEDYDNYPANLKPFIETAITNNNAFALEHMVAGIKDNETPFQSVFSDIEFHTFSQCSAPDVLNTLFKYGLDPQITDANGTNLLINAVGNNYSTDFLNTLIDQDEELLSKQNYVGSRAIHTAAYAGNTKALKLMTERAADINSRGNGRMPIHYAMSQSHYDCVKYLIEAGADTTVTKPRKLTNNLSSNIEFAQTKYDTATEQDKEAYKEKLDTLLWIEEALLATDAPVSSVSQLFKKMKMKMTGREGEVLKELGRQQPPIPVRIYGLTGF